MTKLINELEIPIKIGGVIQESDYNSLYGTYFLVDKNSRDILNLD